MQFLEKPKQLDFLHGPGNTPRKYDFWQSPSNGVLRELVAWWEERTAAD